MVSKNYSLEFKGYQLESGISSWQMKSAIYCVYAGTYDKSTDTFAIRQLLYIGEAENVSSRIGSHQKKTLWQWYLRDGEEFCFSAAPISPPSDRYRAEAAMINHHKPPCNTEYVNNFDYDNITITTNGSNEKLSKLFSVCSAA